MGAKTQGWLQRRRGATVAEYMVILLLAGLVLMVGIRLFGGTLQDKYGGAKDELVYMQDSPDPRPAGSVNRGDKGASPGEEAHGAPVEGLGDGRGARGRGEEARPKSSRGFSLGGYNFFTILIFMALIGLLGYVVFAKKEG